MTTRCADCGTRDHGKHHGGWCRGLCATCYRRHWDANTLDNFPRKLRRRDDVIEDWLFLQAQGYTRPQAAERMGLKRDTLDKAIARAKRDNDPQLQDRKAA